jgi:hypothetical protein
MTAYDKRTKECQTNKLILIVVDSLAKEGDGGGGVGWVLDEACVWFLRIHILLRFS